jgi:hypothetical protein
MTALLLGERSSALFAASLMHFASDGIVKATREGELLFLLQEESSSLFGYYEVSLHLMPFIKNEKL